MRAASETGVGPVLLGPAAERLIVVGEIAGPHGVRGEARMRPFNPDSSVVGDVAEIFLVPDGGEPRFTRLDRARPHGNVWLLILEGLSTPEAVRALSGSRVAVRERELPPLPAGQFYHYQLIGLAVVDDRDRAWGTVSAVLSAGGGDMLVVADAGKERLVPMIDHIVAAVDLPARRIVVHPIDGLFE